MMDISESGVASHSLVIVNGPPAGAFPPHTMSNAKTTPAPLQTLDAACDTISHVLATSLENKDWNSGLFVDTEPFLAYAERDGIVYRKDPRSATESPQRAQRSKICVRMKVAQHMGNQFGTMHGGCIATVVDTFSSLLIQLHTSGHFGQPWAMMGVSQNMIVQYLKPTRIGRWIEIESTMLMLSKSVCMMQVDIYELDSRDGKRTVHTISGSHTKMDVGPKL